MKIHLPYFTAILLALLMSTSSHSEEEDTYLTPDEDPENYDLYYILIPYEEDFFSFLDTPHEIISGGVESMAQGMDLFFADETVYTETTSSYARLSTQTNFNHQGDYSTTGDIRIKIDLKETKKKLKLLLESDTDRDLQTGTDTSTSPGQQNETINFYAALQKEISKKHDWQTKASLGIKLKVPLDPFIRIRAYKDFSVAGWKIGFTETLFWFNSKGAGASSLLGMNHAITKELLFRSTTSALWTDFLDYHEIGQTFTLYHELSDRRAASYNIGSYGISQPRAHLVGYYASIGYRQRIHRDWLFIEVTPAITFDRENQFKSERSLMLKLEMVFGNKYVYQPPEED